MFAERFYLRNYAFAMAVVLSALALRLLLDPMLGEHLVYLFFYFAVGAAAIWGGLGPGLLALVIAYLSANYLFAYPRYSFLSFSGLELLDAFRFFSVALLVAVLGNWHYRRKRYGPLHIGGKEDGPVRAQQEHAQNLLASIGDGLITIDLKGLVTFMNPIAEQLCGWTSDAAKGLHVTKVFPLIDDITRGPVANPALQALEAGAVTMLPENVSLVARDGTERPIDDSAGPIRDAQGRMVGSVLIFRDVTERRVLSRPVQQRPFSIGGMLLHPLDGWQYPLSAEEQTDLERACEDWILREWTLDDEAVRIVPLLGFNLMIRQEHTEEQEGDPSVHFSAAYERLPV
jgi:PAS domain S-box-containing protein